MILRSYTDSLKSRRIGAAAMTTETSFQGCVRIYERVVAGGAGRAELVAATNDVLRGITSSCSKGGFIEKGVSRAGTENWYTRAAAALTRFITNPNVHLKTSDLLNISVHKPTIDYIFKASGFRNMGHLADMLKETHPDGRETLNRQRAAVVLVFIGLDDVPDTLMTIALQQPPNLLLHLVLGWLNQRAVLTPQGEKNRGRLLTSGHLLKGATISDRMIGSLINGWMYCTYATEPRKHEIKKWINQLLLDHMRAAGIMESPVTHSVKKRPKIVVVHERFTANHAMFRCYAPMMRTLTNYFDTVAVADAALISDMADDIFDKVIRLPSARPSVKKIVQLIQAEKPDVVYYPSLGMSHWTVMLACLRLAPIQVMSPGHPATSMLDTIDWLYTPAKSGDLELIHSERVIHGPPGVSFAGHGELPVDLPLLLPPSEREVRIAVNSKVMKLSWRLLEICKRLEKAANLPVRFSFFPGERHNFMDGLDAAIRAHLPASRVVPYCGYEAFLDEMCKCDIALAAFPFGNTNCTVDTCLLGLPTVAHLGPEISAQTDAQVMKMAGMPEWLVCQTDKEYFDTALRLINEPELRASVMANTSRATIKARLVNDQNRIEVEPFGEVLYKLHVNFAKLRGAQKRVYDYTELCTMSS